MKRPTPTEREILDEILRHIRHVAATRAQLTIYVDTYVNNAGVSVDFVHNPKSNAYEFNGPIRAQRKRGVVR
ncbi:MAG TPA: hypothetical protein VGH28_14110 [Polyangiaceae bacterium]|jgi:hypothetical protein